MICHTVFSDWYEGFLALKKVEKIGDLHSSRDVKVCERQAESEFIVDPLSSSLSRTAAELSKNFKNQNKLRGCSRYTTLRATLELIG